MSALERNDRAMWRRVKLAFIDEQIPLSHGGIVGQAWRGAGPRQALLAKALDGMEIRRSIERSVALQESYLPGLGAAMSSTPRWS